jgi:hypothetical protein
MMLPQSSPKNINRRYDDYQLFFCHNDDNKKISLAPQFTIKRINYDFSHNTLPMATHTIIQLDETSGLLDDNHYDIRFEGLDQDIVLFQFACFIFGLIGFVFWVLVLNYYDDPVAVAS